MTNISSISITRLSSYKLIFQCGNDQDTLKFYYWNQAVSAELYILLHNIEVCLRNKIHETLSLAASSQASKNFAWYDQFDFSKPGLDRFGQPNQTKTGLAIKKVKEDLSDKNKAITPQNVISNLEFGKWAYLIQTKKLKNGSNIDWATHYPLIFSNYSTFTRKGRKILFNRLDEVRLLRNRVAHLEPVWKFGKKEVNGVQIQAPNDLNSVLIRLNKEISWVINVLEWICPDSYAHYIQTNSYRKLRILVSETGMTYFSI
jgi:hypothetical protein